jgi:hypothetical protein
MMLVDFFVFVPDNLCVNSEIIIYSATKMTLLGHPLNPQYSVPGIGRASHILRVSRWSVGGKEDRHAIPSRHI